MRINKIKVLTICIFIMLVLSGCVATTIGIAKIITTGSLPSSAYLPLFISSKEEWHKHVRLLESVSNKVIEDEFATHYYSDSGDHFKYFILPKALDAPMRNEFTKGVGLMEPIYKYNKLNVLEMDVEGTKKRYYFLQNKLRLKLTPIGETYKYNELIIKFKAFRERNRVTGASLLFNASNEIAVRNSKYSSEVLDHISSNYTYLILNNCTESFFGGGTLSQHGVSSIQSNQQIYFSPRSLYANIESSPNLITNPSCGTYDKKPGVYSIEESKIRQNEDRIHLTKTIDTINANLISIRSSNENGCEIGFQALNIITSIKSNKL